jgi:hypothetical protein
LSIKQKIGIRPGFFVFSTRRERKTWASEFEFLRMCEIWKLRVRDERPFKEIGERLLVSESHARTLLKKID